MTLRISVDTGGTFTDVVACDENTGNVRVTKFPSTPDDPGSAVLSGVTWLLAELERGAAEVGYFAHGTTVGTNALLTENGVSTAIVSTAGFRDLLELGRGNRPRLYDLQADKARPLVPRHARFEVTERVRHDGTVETPLDEEEVRVVARRIRELDVHAVAVCLLYSFMHPEHERRVAEILRAELDGVYVTLSSEVLPEFREFERLSTVTINAYVGPTMEAYLSNLRNRLEEHGLRVTPHVTQSNGGVISFEAAESLPVRTVLSGPSTGVIGAAEIATTAGYPDIITFDMGGTSSDVSLVNDGVPRYTNSLELDGRPIRSPMLDIHTVGAGGGSVAWVDAGGALKVGPHSAGSDPGPASYGRGTDPTVTDANIVLRTLNPQHLLNGKMPIDSAASEAAVGRVAEQLGLSTVATAHGILRVVVANMARAIRVISVQRGYDPRRYVLVPFGGAGPLHASLLARELGVDTVLVPRTPGAQSALGLLMTDLRADFFRTTAKRYFGTNALQDINAIYTELHDQAEEWFRTENIPEGERSYERSIELRYTGQNYEIPVPVPDGELNAAALETVLKEFETEHQRLYGYVASAEPVEAVTYRLQGVGAVPHASLRSHDPATETADVARTTTRAVQLGRSGTEADVPVYHRDRLRPGHTFTGPAVVEQMDASTVVLPEDHVCIDDGGNLVITVGSANEEMHND